MALSAIHLPASSVSRHFIYVNPHMRTISLCVMRLPICEFFCLTPRTHSGTPSMHMGTSFWCVFDLSAIFGWVMHWTRFFWMWVRTHQHKKTSLVEYCLVHHNIFCVARSPFAFRDIISLPICVRGYRSAHHIRDIAPHSSLVLSLPIWISFHINPRMHTGIDQIPVCIRGSRSIPVCIQGSQVM